mmetsp:Transcript_42347/g.90083  ORF Transcript_42347/g.90083 Transcript_42347/m.90083 type:complete len:659 (-) Transcript_42347:147-2123(-)|eukprot:CAMPEP_0172553250 /NCGR_PEP_ID=MMETSP1067-20121228/49670_1 /TAXON_ID=265564 ORGANISM="Thalassiosira punctigera, Strain Tpunct2005C2" /NCGR_SAMPLE_ID=MMETSP1067 /ASSEMBLY_ACC=CAM_ASM_000444 /LENGTH=658 /DNA_ID=CAMNT_0013341405 /DNA_START=118 /DNA_END=2094 /DNA_ORIENTATION=+
MTTSLRPIPAFLLLFALLLVGRDDHGASYSVATAFLAPRPPLVARSKHRVVSSMALAAESTAKNTSPSSSSDVTTDFPFRHAAIDTHNEPPNLRAILSSLLELKSGSDLRGTYVGHRSSGGTIANISDPIKALKRESGGVALTPFAAHCFGAAFARWLLSRPDARTGMDELKVCIGRDPRLHGERLADAFARGVEGVDGEDMPVKVLYTDVATTPSMYEFVRADKCDAAVMITASHLPEEKNGMKFFSKGVGGLTSQNIGELIDLAQDEARQWYDMGILPSSSGNAGVLCSEIVDFMPYYKESLQRAIIREVDSASALSDRPLSGLNIVVNPGNGAGCFFADLLRDLGANIAGSIHLTPDGTFPNTFGVPNPEKKEMVEETIRACEANDADVGIMFDTDADRSGFVLPRTVSSSGTRADHEALNGNRMIALISAVFSRSSPGCTIVTDSTTSEALSEYLENNLGLRHYRYVRGYANVIGKAEELTESGQANAEVAVEISGHCAMKENGYVDDGTYTAVKIIGLLARVNAEGKSKGSLLDLISDLKEMPYEEEMRIRVTDGSLDTTTYVFQQLTQSLKEKSEDGSAADWALDEDNQEGVRFRLLSGGHFMIRQSLHDPVISMQVESISQEEAREKVLDPLLMLLSEHDSVIDYSALKIA